jgi:hypothetical protein
MYYRVKKRAQINNLKLPGNWKLYKKKKRRYTYKEQSGYVKPGLIVREIMVKGAVDYADWVLVQHGSRRFYIRECVLEEVSPLEALAKINL